MYERVKLFAGEGAFIYVMVTKESKRLQNFRLNEKDQAGTSCWLQTAFRSNNGKLLPEFFTMV